MSLTLPQASLQFLPQPIPSHHPHLFLFPFPKCVPDPVIHLQISRSTPQRVVGKAEVHISERQRISINSETLHLGSTNKETLLMAHPPQEGQFIMFKNGGKGYFKQEDSPCSITFQGSERLLSDQPGATMVRVPWMEF